MCLLLNQRRRGAEGRGAAFEEGWTWSVELGQSWQEHAVPGMTRMCRAGRVPG
jgi:hypothetical protein